MVAVLNPFRGDISDQSVLEWLEQFEPNERPIINRLLKAFRYYGSAKVADLVKRLHQDILKLSNRPESEMWFIPVGYVAKSGSIIAYYFRVQNNLRQDHFVSSADLSALPLNEQSTVVFLDDFLGTGGQARQTFGLQRC